MRPMIWPQKALWTIEFPRQRAALSRRDAYKTADTRFVRFHEFYSWNFATRTVDTERLLSDFKKYSIKDHIIFLNYNF